MDNYVTDDACKSRSGEILAAITKLNDRLYKDNGTISVQTRLDRHEQTLRLLAKLVYGALAIALLAIGKAIISLVVMG